SYNSIFNIDEKCNTFQYKKTEAARNWTTVSIPLGAYEISDIEKAMISALQISANDKDEKILSVRANNNTLKCEIECKYSLLFGGENTIAKVLGFFEDVMLKKMLKHESMLSVDIIKVRIVRIDCNITSGAYVNSQQGHTIFEFDIDVEPGYKLSKEPQNVIYMPLKPSGRQFIDNITLRILDDNGDLIDFRGEKIIIKLELKKIT
ncbi:MAG: hypothetical protein ACRD52_19060, partial [Candidatus Acidiferrales bacterium]